MGLLAHTTARHKVRRTLQGGCTPSRVEEGSAPPAESKHPASPVLMLTCCLPPLWEHLRLQTQTLNLASRRALEFRRSGGGTGHAAAPRKLQLRPEGIHGVQKHW
eukprot:Hpha_TRINITY_DN15691_c1_g1::TRINITY_DN15691_c1_g1_i3::g.101017::m.101017